MDDYAFLLAQIETLSTRAKRSFGELDLLLEIEDVLSDGYTAALTGEARMIRLEEQLEALLDSGDARRARELRLLVREHLAVERAVAVLRSALDRLHSEFVALGGARLEVR